MLTVDQRRYSTDVKVRELVTADASAYLLERIRTREATVAIIGLGYVGLPLAVAFAEAGFHVTGIDIDPKRVSSLNAGRSYVSDIPPERLLPLLPKAQMAADGALLFGLEARMTARDRQKPVMTLPPQPNTTVTGSRDWTAPPRERPGRSPRPGHPASDDRL